MLGREADRLQHHLPEWHTGRLRQIKEEILGQPSIDFLTLAYRRAAANKSLN